MSRAVPRNTVFFKAPSAAPSTAASGAPGPMTPKTVSAPAGAFRFNGQTSWQAWHPYRTVPHFSRMSRGTSAGSAARPWMQRFLSTRPGPTMAPVGQAETQASQAPQISPGAGRASRRTSARSVSSSPPETGKRMPPSTKSDPSPGRKTRLFLPMRPRPEAAAISFSGSRELQNIRYDGKSPAASSFISVLRRTVISR